MASETPARTFGAWLTMRDLMEFLPAASLSAARQWAMRHGVVRRGNGSVARRDVEQALERMAKKALQTKRGLHPNTLANLLKSRTRTKVPA